MSLLRRARLLGSSSRPTASTSALQSPSDTPQISTSSLQAHSSHAEDDPAESTALSRMKRAAGLALGMIQTGSRLAAEATSDVGIPGLSIGLSALAEILHKVQDMKTTVDGVEELYNHVAALDAALRDFRSPSQDQVLPRQMIERMDRLAGKWQHIGDRAKKVKSHGKIKRFFTSDADAQALRGLVDEMNNSLQDELLAGLRNIERDVHHIRQGTEMVVQSAKVTQDSVELVRNNIEEARGEIEEVLGSIGAVGENVEAVREDLVAAQEDLGNIRVNVSVISERVEAVRQGVEGGIEGLQEDVEAFSDTMEALRDGVGVIGTNVQAVRDDLRQVAKAIAANVDANFLATYAKMAPYNANEVRRSCLEGTRVEFLQEVYTWITDACNDDTTTADSRILLWINGMGGTGKTTVAHSAAGWCDGKRLLGGSFFCSRTDADCSNPNLVFPSLCRQLCAHHKPYKDEVEKVLQATPDVASYGLFRQFEELIVQPLEKLDAPFPRSVLVLDALDELKDKGAKWTILSVIAKFVAQLAKFLLFIVTSRPEERITALFEASRKDSLSDNTKPLLMQDIPLNVALKDLRLYVDHEFDDHVGVLSIKPGWPSVQEKDALVRQSRGLFIYIVTAIKFIMDEAYRDPKGQMDSLTDSTENSSTPQDFLSELYSKILVASYEKASEKLSGWLRDVLGTVVLAQESLSPSTIARLVGLDVADVRNTLTGLHSVLHIPAVDSHPIRIIHPTFPEFVLQLSATIPPERPELGPETAPLCFQPSVQHWRLFSWCIKAMSEALKRDMVGIQYPAMFRSEVKNLKDKVDEAIKPHISYACRFWSDHLHSGIKGAATPDVLNLFHNFVCSKLPYWVEACSLLDALDKAILALEMAHNACQSLGDLAGDLALLLADCRRFVVTYSPCIHAAPLQIYYCTLSIAPTNSAVRNAYAYERKQALVVEHGSPSGWAPCLDAVSGHGGSGVYAVAISQDGSCFVTGGGDQKATVWKTATRTPIVSFDGHTGDVNCVAYAPDGLHVASGSDDMRVYVWQTSSGECIYTLEGHTDRVWSVVYSGDGRRIVSATLWGEVKLWDAPDGRCLLTLKETGNWTCQVGISQDGAVIARGNGASLCLHDVASLTSEELEFPDEPLCSRGLESSATYLRGGVSACVFSPDGRYIAARSEHVIRVWAWPGKSVVRSIDVTESLTSRLAFSRDGTLVGCGSMNGTVLLWPAASEDSPRTLQGHTHLVSNLVYSPDKSQAISVAYDGIRVWDLTLSSIPVKERPALDLPSSACDPPRFALIRSGAHPIALLDLPALGIDAECFPIGAQMPVSAPTATLFSDVVSAWDAALQVVEDWYGSTAREWELLTGQRHFQLTPDPFAISPDSALMAYLSPTSDSAVDVCDLRTGAVVATLTGHTNDVYSIAFSPDKSRVATGSHDCSVKIWDTATGDLLCGHTEHRGWMRAVTFSPDGRLVASGSYDQTVRIFEITTERVVRVLDLHRGYVMEVMFAEDSIHLVALYESHWVYIHNVETGARIHEFCLQDHSRLRSPIFSTDGSGILVGSGGGASAPRTITLRNPGARPWPVYHITLDGWVYAVRQGKTQRLCWLPPEWRTPLRSEGSMLYVGEGVSGPREKRRVIVLNMSRLLQYVDALDARQ